MKSGFATTTHIRVPPAAVFRFLADPLTASVIDPAVVHYEPEGGTMGLGVHNHILLRIMGIPMKLTSETTAWKPGQWMEFRSIRPTWPVIAVATHRFQPSPGGTTYTWSMEFVPTGLGGRLVAALSAAMFERNARAQQQRVRVVLEAALA